MKLLSKSPGLGSIHNLYESIEQLDDQHFSTKACKNMLLTPRSAAEELCEDLKLDLDDDPKPREFYSCKKNSCISLSTCYYSSVWETRCPYCGNLMDVVRWWIKDATTENDGAFIKRNSAKFIITDDFRVTPSSLLHYYDILIEFGIKNTDLLEERTLEFGRKELLNLLEKSLKREEVLTNICFPDSCIQSTAPIHHDCKEIIKCKSKDSEDHKEEDLQISLIINKTNNEVVCAEIGEKFANQLFSFLIFPLGYVLKLVDHFSSFGCMTNLYKSVQGLKINYFKSEKAKNMLISPLLAPTFGYNQQVLNIRELYRIRDV